VVTRLAKHAKIGQISRSKYRHAESRLREITRLYFPLRENPPPNVPKIAMKGLQELVSGPDPKEQVKKWKAAMRGESRKIDRNIRGPVWRVNPLHIRKST